MGNVIRFRILFTLSTNSAPWQDDKEEKKTWSKNEKWEWPSSKGWRNQNKEDRCSSYVWKQRTLEEERTHQRVKLQRRRARQRSVSEWQPAVPEPPPPQPPSPRMERKCDRGLSRPASSKTNLSNGLSSLSSRERSPLPRRSHKGLS